MSDVVMAAALIVVAASPEDYDIWASPIVAAGQEVVSLVAGSSADQGPLTRLLTDLADEWTDPSAREDLQGAKAAPPSTRPVLRTVVRRPTTTPRGPA